MRQLRELPDRESALALCDALSSSGLEVSLQESQRGTFTVWVIDEAQLTRGQDLVRAWLDDGQQQAYDEAVRRGRAARELRMRIEERKLRHRQLLAERLARLRRPRPTPLTWGLIALCVAVHLALFILGQLGEDERAMVAALTIVDPRQPLAQHTVSLFGFSFTWLTLPRDQPWRVLTPVLLHFHLFHILFNLLWLRDLGRIVETVHGTRYLAGVVLLAAALPNIAQYELTGHPLFGGMSGVVYALLGLVWLRGRLDPSVGYALSRSTVQFMLIWLALGFFPHFGVASFCHLGGLIVGGVWAIVAAWLSRRSAQRPGSP